MPHVKILDYVWTGIQLNNTKDFFINYGKIGYVIYMNKCYQMRYAALRGCIFLSSLTGAGE